MQELIKHYEFLLIKKILIFRLYKGLNTYENITLMILPWLTDLAHLQK